MQFFLDEVAATNLEFQLAESVEIIEALNNNKEMTLEEKHKFWEENFKKAFLDNMHRLNSGRISSTLRIFDAFRDFEYYDEDIWDKIITMMDRKTGWARTAIIERLYPLTGTFEKAKLLFDKYYTKVPFPNSIALNQQQHPMAIQSLRTATLFFLRNDRQEPIERPDAS